MYKSSRENRMFFDRTSEKNLLPEKRPSKRSASESAASPRIGLRPNDAANPRKCLLPKGAANLKRGLLPKDAASP